MKSCDGCQRHEYAATAPKELLRPLLLPDRIWEDIELNFITRLPKYKGEYVFTVVDRLSEYAHFILLQHPHITKTVADLSAM